MRRKNEEYEPDVEGIARRLREERPEAGALELDQIKTTAMSRAKAASARANPRRLVVAALTFGLMAAGTGGVLAAGGSGSSVGNAAQAQYSTTISQCDVGNNNGNGNGNGNGSGNGNNNYNCNDNSFNENNTTNNITNNYFSSSPTVTVTNTETASGDVKGFSTTKKAKTSSRHVKIHVHVPHKAKLRKVSISVNGRHLKTVRGKQASANVVLVNLPCGSGSTTVKITVTLSSGKTVTESHTYHLCT